MTTLPPYNRPNQVGALQRFSVAWSYTKQHCDDTHRHRGGHRNTPVGLSFLPASFGYPQKFGSVLLLIQRLIVHIRPPRSVQTAHTAHDMHMNTDINTYTFSLNALLCPRRSELEMKRCINKTLPAVTKGPCKVTRHECEGPGSSGYIPSSPQLAVCLYPVSVHHRWVLSCISNLWLSESPALHFLLVFWLGTWERGSGLIRYLHGGPRTVVRVCHFAAVLSFHR